MLHVKDVKKFVSEDFLLQDILRFSPRQDFLLQDAYDLDDTDAFCVLIYSPLSLLVIQRMHVCYSLKMLRECMNELIDLPYVVYSSIQFMLPTCFIFSVMPRLAFSMFVPDSTIHKHCRFRGESEEFQPTFCA